MSSLSINNYRNASSMRLLKYALCAFSLAFAIGMNSDALACSAHHHSSEKGFVDLHNGSQLMLKNGTEVRRSHPHSRYGKKFGRNSHHGKMNESKQLVLSNSHFIFFDHNSDQLSEYEKELIRRILEEANIKNVIQFKVAGHSSADGNSEYNMQLSMIRAKAIKKELEKMGVDADKIAVAGFGAKVPFDRGTRRYNPEKDRRAEIRYVHNSK